MSTRCSITCKCEGGEFSLYRHSDGYPDTQHGVLATIAQALRYSWSIPRFEPCDFGAAIIRAWKNSGGDIRLSHGRDSHGDTEYHYEVTREGNAIRVQCFKSVGNRETAETTWKKGKRVLLTRAMQAALTEGV